MRQYSKVSILLLLGLLQGSPASVHYAAAQSAAVDCELANVPAILENDDRQIILKQLRVVGIKETIDADAMRLICVNNGGKPVPVLQMGFKAESRHWWIARIELGREEYVFGLDVNKNAYFFRTDAQFRLLGRVVNLRDGALSHASADRSATIYKNLMDAWKLHLTAHGEKYRVP